jgi:hypothetical protein
MANLGVTGCLVASSVPLAALGHLFFNDALRYLLTSTCLGKSLVVVVVVYACYLIPCDLRCCWRLAYTNDGLYLDRVTVTTCSN